MPLLNENDAPFLGWDVVGDFSSRLPSRQEIENAVTSKFFELTTNDYFADSWNNFAESAMKTVFRIAETWGVEEFRIPGIEDFSINLKQLQGLSPAQMVVQLTKQVVRQTLDLVFDTIGAIPIVGWIVDIAWNVAETIWTFVELFREQAQPPALAVQYTRDSDDRVTNEAIETARSNDWTRVFMPMAQPNGFDRTSVAFDHSGVEAWYISPRGNVDSSALAIMPGFPRAFGEFQIGKYVQPRKHPLPGDPAPRDIGFGPAANLGSFVPSLQQTGFSMWSLARKNSANAFKLDADKLELAWSDWFQALIDYIKYEFDSSEPPDQKAQIVNWLARYTAMGWYQTNSSDGPFGSGLHLWEESGLASNERFAEFFDERFGSPGFMFPGFQFWNEGPFDPDPEKRNNASNAPIAGSYFVSWLPGIKFFLRNYRKALIDQFTKTLTVAYVGPDFPALKNPSVRKSWEDHRKLLLSHSARANVELDLIPDQAYANAMAQAQSQPFWDITASPTPQSGIVDLVPAVPVPPEFPVPPSIPSPGAKRRRRAFSRAEAGMLALMVGGATAWKGPELVQMASRAIARRRR